ncbi:type II secretion system F family protein [Methanospirillum purgamenti]|jgi:flagellar protein FlaJ|uniref:Type II secretion system F family protein n=1 Tax=Methanospirillum hungatei TaxID=2203 RepID=A0A8F5VKS3_METHU|nr:type II secretion system F family protein [Methanospirillum hungatei]QXO94831.1 type II secretion system F family protein [Methanospirillum hungatei]
MITSRIVTWLVYKNPKKYGDIHNDLIGIRSGKTLEQFLNQALMVGILTGLIFGLIGVITGYALFSLNFGLKPELYNVLNISFDPETGNLPIIILIQILLGTVLTIIGAIVGYWTYIMIPALTKKGRETKITIGLPNAVSYMYAMRKGGAEIITILRSISEMSAIYGEVSYEFRQAVRDADFFGYDIINALKRLSETTPSSKLRDFLQDLISTVESGGNLSDFLKDRVMNLQEEVKFEQKEFLQFLGLVAEIYVTIFIAGPLFLIVILVVMGMMGSSAILELSLIGYAVLPIGATIFILMIDTISIKDENVVTYVRAKWLNQYSDVRISESGNEEHLFSALAKFEKLQPLKQWLSNPLQGFIQRPELTFIFSVPAAVIYASYFFLTIPIGTLEDTINYLDDQVMIALLIALIPFAFFYTRWNQIVRSIEAMIPDFLDRMAGINEVGITLTQSIAVISRANMGVLGYEIKKIHRDIEWGANFSDALIRFEHRIKTGLIARTVTLITKAATMSNSIASLLRIAANDARISENLKRDRFSEMFIYTAIVYLSFFVFIFVIGVITTQFLTVLAEQSKSGLAMAGPLANLGSTSLITMDRLLYHICLIQGLCSGLVAGLMGESSIKAGVKHSCILIIGALIAFNFMF